MGQGRIPRTMMAAFLEVSVDGETRSVPLVHRTVIGRSQDSEVALPNDLLVSRTHAVIEQYAAGWVVRDLGAANGTFVNGVRVVAERVLHPGDEIRVGDSILIFQGGPPADRRSTLVVERREHVFILFTDIVGSTEQSMATESEVANQQRLHHFLVLRRAIFDSGGLEIKTLGDGIMAVFPTSTSVVSCAVAMQQAIDKDNRASRANIGLRVGASCGEATRDAVDYFGPVVVEASRLCALASGGQILVSDALRVAVRHGAPVEFRSLGAKELKGFAEPVRVHEVAWVQHDQQRGG
jgi:class 3 adenylate cyclase